ncbi:hypothetical protein B0H10DRAFT_1981080 [Mycena sp. CBHHK59/15]|nr:hypothetical protein B0H10DRAFT_1981080 [Mycena sp. CBHHK59/15]
MSFQDLGIPASSSTVTVKTFDVAEDFSKIKVPAASFFKPVLPGHENYASPLYAFLIEHVATKQRVMFDLGIRKDVENAAPALYEVFKSGAVSMPVKQDIVEQLTEGGIDVGSISAVIWSHTHFDHTGDMSKFPSTTDLVVGLDAVMETYILNPMSTLLESDVAGHKLVQLNFEKSDLEIGGFRAHDFFADGSLYLLDVPGHLLGHMCALARVAPNSFVFLGADSCHHAGQFRPTDKLHQHFPCPGELLAATRRTISAKYFPSSGSASNEDEFDLATRATPLLEVSDEGYYEDKGSARASIRKLGDFDANADVFVVLGHDASLVPIIGLFPASLNGWKENGWKKTATWAFVDEGNPAFRFSAVAHTDCFNCRTSKWSSAACT